MPEREALQAAYEGAVVARLNALAVVAEAREARQRAQAVRSQAALRRETARRLRGESRLWRAIRQVDLPVAQPAFWPGSNNELLIYHCWFGSL
jgi:hypothetical protein